MDPNESNLDERIRKQQEIMNELDQHYQEHTIILMKQVEELEQFLADLKQKEKVPNMNSENSKTAHQGKMLSGSSPKPKTSAKH